LEERLRQARKGQSNSPSFADSSGETRATTSESPVETPDRPWFLATAEAADEIEEVDEGNPDESFDWMKHVSALAARLRGESPSEVTQEARAPAPTARSASTSAPAVKEQEVPSATEEVQLLESIPSRRDKTQNVDLTVLRDVANQNARTAIGTYEHRQALQLAAFKWLVALAAVFTGTAVIFIFRQRSLLGYLLAGICWTVAAFWTCRGALTYRHSIRKRSHAVPQSTPRSP
jgi:hypothetical protein